MKNKLKKNVKNDANALHLYHTPLQFYVRNKYQKCVNKNVFVKENLEYKCQEVVLPSIYVY